MVLTLYLGPDEDYRRIERTLSFDYLWGENYLLMSNVVMYKNVNDRAPDDATSFTKNDVMKFERITPYAWLITHNQGFACNLP